MNVSDILKETVKNGQIYDMALNDAMKKIKAKKSNVLSKREVLTLLEKMKVKFENRV